MKKIAVLDIAASKTGALSILQDFAAFVRKYDKENEWYFITGAEGLIEPSEHLHVLTCPDVKSSKLNRLKFDHITGAQYLSSLGCDVVFSMQNTLPKGKIIGRDGKSAKTAVYVHQPLGYQTWKKFSPFKKQEREYAMYQYLISREIDASVRRADKVIVQTEWMKDAVAKKTGISRDKIAQILPDVPEVTEHFDLSKWSAKKFIYPAGSILYKNHQLIVDAVNILNKQGYTDFEVIFTLKREEAPWIEGETSSNIKWNGSMERNELMKLYAESTLIFPSYIETYGFPPAEARMVGTMVLAADMPFTHEVLRGYNNCSFFNAFSATELAEKMEEIMLGNVLPCVKESEETTHENSYARIVAELLA
ncbi:MAG: glycosyltransferase [Lachnospiraceae bacterium]|nr:glycosyltransferase [Lachnospiraceae bacterium]